MRMHVVEQATREAYRLSLLTYEPGTLCAFTAGVHRLLSDLAREANFVQAIGLRAAAGIITKLRGRMGCQ